MKDHFIYLPDLQAATAWECNATSTGYARVPPGGPYPPHRHPADHHFTWQDGRILDSYTLIFITEGSGVFESAVSPRKVRVEAGTVLVVFPKVWHRYAPDPATGWTEFWIECRGAALDRAVALGLIDPKRPVLPTGLDPDLLHCFERCYALAQRPGAGQQSALSTLALHILAVLERAGQDRGAVPRKMDEAVQRAQRLILERYDQALGMEEVARELGVGYSHFRQAFRARTGLSPKQYHLQLRLQKAQDFLANTPMTVKEISELLGFDSPFHLSNQFKARTGLSPQTWRARLQRPQRRSSATRHGNLGDTGV